MERFRLKHSIKLKYVMEKGSENLKKIIQKIDSSRFSNELLCVIESLPVDNFIEIIKNIDNEFKVWKSLKGGQS